MKHLRLFSFLIIIILFAVFFSSSVFSQSTTSSNSITTTPAPTVNAPPAKEPEPARKSSSEYVRMAWAASGKNDLKSVIEITNECVALYGKEAKKQQASLSEFPPVYKTKDYQELNDVGTCLFIQAEAFMNNGRGEEAKAAFERAIKDYKFAQAWDPSRGSHWSVAEKSKASIDVLTGVRSEEEEKYDPNVLRTKPKFTFKGKKQVVDYRQYGKFTGVGTKDYKYEMVNNKGLAEALGEGIYPNSTVQKDPLYKKLKEEGRLQGSHWDYVYSEDLEAAFFKWATASEPTGVRLFYLALIFEKAGMYYEAVKTYHAIVVNFPQSVGWTYWHTPWYPAQAAIAKIKHIIRLHPELNLKFEWAKVQVLNGYDNDIGNDIVITYPGVLSKKTPVDHLKEKMNLTQVRVKLNKIKKTVGSGRVRLIQYENKHWQLMVDGKPYVIKGMTYTATKIGQSPDKGTLVSWMKEDTNKNGLADGPFDSWVDKNENNKQDPDEPTVGDFKLLKEMGVNTLREYHQPFEPDKELLRKMYKDYGIMVILGDFLGKYAFGSGASWYEGTDYENPEHKKNMMATVRKMVMDYKDEPYILMWLLGNENNYGVASNADKKPEAYYKFVNEVALMIKSIDPNHPVAICNGDTLFLDIFGKNAPDVDIFAANVYRGDYGFGSFWEQVADVTDFGKPAFVTEYGAPAYAKHLSREAGEQAQADYHDGNWGDIQDNLAGYRDGMGNALGGVVFEWMDEWWKNYEPYFHDKKSDAIGPFPGGFYYEEWFGITGQGNGKNSPFLRHLRKTYSLYQKYWK